MNENNIDENSLKTIFAKNLCKYVKETGKTQKELAKIIGVSESTFSSWCIGIKTPRMDKIEKLANYFEISKSDLIEETPSPRLRSIARLGENKFTPEEEEKIIDYMNYLLSKREDKNGR